LGELLSTPVDNNGDNLWGTPGAVVDTMPRTGAQPVGGPLGAKVLIYFDLLE